MGEKFEDFLTAKNGLIDNAAYHLACAIAAKEAVPSQDSLEWDMAYIGEIVDAAEQILKEHVLRHCHPFYEGDGRVPCYHGKDCTVADCPLKSGFDIAAARRGQEITEEQYNHYLNILPPISLKGGQGFWGAGFQLSEPYSHEQDTRIGRPRPTYATFTSCGSRYFYQGINFAGEVDSRPYMENYPETGEVSE